MVFPAARPAEVGARNETGGAHVAPRYRRILSQALLIGLIATAVGLSACGRKGALEAPYAAVKADEAVVNPAAAPEKPNKPFILDPLLN